MVTPQTSPIKNRGYLSPSQNIMKDTSPRMQKMGENLYVGSKGCLSSQGDLHIDVIGEKKVSRVLLIHDEDMGPDIRIPHPGTTVRYIKIARHIDPIESGSLVDAHKFLNESKLLNEPTLVCGGYGLVRAPFVVATYRMLTEDKSYADVRRNMLSHLQDARIGPQYYQSPSPFQRCATFIEQARTVEYGKILDDDDKRKLYDDYISLVEDDDKAAQNKPASPANKKPEKK